MKPLFRQALVVFAALTIVCGVLYPAVVTLVAQAAFQNKANGSIIEGNKGSKLIGQNFTEAKYLIGRPDSGSPSNLNPSSSEEEKLVAERVAFFHKLDSANTKQIPIDLVTSSASGVDPNISVAAAEYQLDRIAKARDMSPSAVEKIIKNNTENRALGFMGEPVVNVLGVNLELDQKVK
ncbi:MULTISPECIES: potassium-transporting ATPase subunit KdpC [Listeria]|uniref:potassium-transporting ATPase subunit KdpC n=1 Tax=Listeria TaxID=1637 RepID=UPI000B589B85|nr:MULTISPECIES: potassium-transporting ATPase subunit KdpC [Listeria]